MWVHAGHTTIDLAGADPVDPGPAILHRPQDDAP